MQLKKSFTTTTTLVTPDFCAVVSVEEDLYATKTSEDFNFPQTKFAAI